MIMMPTGLMPVILRDHLADQFPAGSSLLAFMPREPKGPRRRPTTAPRKEGRDRLKIQPAALLGPHRGIYQVHERVLPPVSMSAGLEGARSESQLAS
jgi:hypothetical protein